jgi:hypothetical protein
MKSRNMRDYGGLSPTKYIWTEKTLLQKSRTETKRVKLGIGTKIYKAHLLRAKDVCTYE